MGDRLPRIRLAAVQAAPVFMDREASIAKTCELICEAADNGAGFVAFPENFIPGYPLWYYFHSASDKLCGDFAVQLFNNSLELPSAGLERILRTAAEAKIFVVLGITEKRLNTTGTLYNTQLFIDRRGNLVGKHQKLVPTVIERLVHAPGDGRAQGVVHSEFGPVSGLICGENSNPMALALLAAQYTRIHVASWPSHLTPTIRSKSGAMSLPEVSLVVARHIAYMTKSYVISSCGIPAADMVDPIAVTDGDREFLYDSRHTGGSCIVDPFGKVIAGPLVGPQAGIVYADADIENEIRGKIAHDFGGHYNRSDIFKLNVSSSSLSLIGSEPGFGFPKGPLLESDERMGISVSQAIVDGSSSG